MLRIMLGAITTLQGGVLEKGHLMRRVVFTALLAALVVAGSPPPSGSLRAQGRPVNRQDNRFFSYASEARLSAPIARPLAVVARNRIEIDVQALDPAVSSTLVFPLRDGDYTAQRVSFVARAPQDVTWTGKIVSSDGSTGDVILTAKNGVVSGLIYTPTRVYVISPSGDSGHFLSELDERQYRPDEIDWEPAAVQPKEEATRTPELEAITPRALDTTPPVIDVLVLYTAGSRDEAGGTAEIEAVSQNAIDVTNTAFTNSNLDIRVRLAGSRLYDYKESGQQRQDLRQIAQDSTVAKLRDDVKADLVALLVNTAESDEGCGYGNIITRVAGNPRYAFSVTKLSCAIGNLTFTHELGHNFGCNHDPVNGNFPPDEAVFPYAFAHFVDGAFRTVMSYDTECKAGCRRVPYFSAPHISFSDAPTGIARERNNRLVIENTAASLAGYR